MSIVPGPKVEKIRKKTKKIKKIKIHKQIQYVLINSQMVVVFYIKKSNHLRIYFEHIMPINFHFCIFEIFVFFDCSTLGPGTMLIASGPEFCEERRIRFVRSS